MGFTLNIDGKTTSDFSYLSGGGFGPSTDTIGIINSFFAFTGSDLIDRGAISGTASSPLRYTTTGTTPNRIFKFEAFNAGFYDEGDLYGTLDDSINFQMWVYETTNIVELRFGASKITNPSDYFYFGNAPMFGYGKDFNMDSFTITKGYSLTGTPSAPSIDSFTDLMSSTFPTLSSYPASGTVYRFIPKAVASSIGESAIATKFQVYPTITADNITIIADNIAATSGKFIDINGKVITVIQNIENGKNTFDVSNLASGNYLLEISNAEGKAVYKFTKQ
jgi:hypothetical protein